MKLYATMSSERESRIVKKGGDKFVRIELHAKNKRIGQVELHYMELNGSLNTYDQVTLLYYPHGSSGYKVIDATKIEKAKQ